MYKQSFFMVILALLLVGIISSGSRLVAAIPGLNGLPSSYDPKVNIEQAASTSNVPLLVEFYTDECHTCQIVTPWVHQLQDKYRNQLTFVMINLDDPQQNAIANIFAVQYVPAIFVFDAKHMVKAQVDTSAYASKKDLDKAIELTMHQVELQAQSKDKGA